MQYLSQAWFKYVDDFFAILKTETSNIDDLGYYLTKNFIYRIHFRNRD